jgi:hypothetical protein
MLSVTVFIDVNAECHIFIVILSVVLKGVIMLIVVAPFVQRVTDNVMFLSKK